MEKNYLTDKHISMKEKGIISVLKYANDNGIQINHSMLLSMCSDKISAIETGIRNLKSIGYIQVEKLMPSETQSGRIEYVYNISEAL